MRELKVNEYLDQRGNSVNRNTCKAAVIALAALAVVACGPGESGPAKTSEVIKAASKPAGAKQADEAPRSVDPMKDGY